MKRYILNRLNRALSPYLRQHADNPVYWQPWDENALAQAKREDKPILLSIGYAACHWCHVMAHESFADEQTATLMNTYFVNIKVDREERPDIDRIYQAAHYVFRQGAGGWPLTMFLTPDGTPFFGGTYFPQNARSGLPAFCDVLIRVAKTWREKREAILQQNKTIISLLQKLDKTTPATSALNASIVAKTATHLEKIIDRNNGGLGDAPKFPHPVELAFCLETATRQNNTALLSIVQMSLQKIADGGLADHLGGGFFRYCVDAGWRIPHFEKMLYDNGLLLALFADAQTALPELRDTLEKTASWLINDMRTNDGRFYASLDADTEDGEGAFYLWEEEIIKDLLSADEYDSFVSHYGLGTNGEINGKIHLTQRQTAAQTATATKRNKADSRRLLNSANAKLHAARQQRPQPALDNKILTAWNGLAIRGLARAGRLCGNNDWITAANTAFAAVITQHRRNERTAAVGYRQTIGEYGFLDDTAFLLDAALELLRCQVTSDTLNIACALANELCEHFEDQDNGGFFFTANDGEKLIRRLKTADDNATPSGNGVAARALLTLSWLSGNIAYHAAAERTLRAFADAMQQMPAGCTSLLSALQWFCHPPALVFLCGNTAICKKWQHSLETVYTPDMLLFIIPTNESDLPEVLKKAQPPNGASAHVCIGNACLPPVQSLAELRRVLANDISHR